MTNHLICFIGQDILNVKLVVTAFLVIVLNTCLNVKNYTSIINKEKYLENIKHQNC